MGPSYRFAILPGRFKQNFTVEINVATLCHHRWLWMETTIGDQNIEWVTQSRLLGVTIDNKLTWSFHILEDNKQEETFNRYLTFLILLVQSTAPYMHSTSYSKCSQLLQPLPATWYSCSSSCRWKKMIHGCFCSISRNSMHDAQVLRCKNNEILQTPVNLWIVLMLKSPDECGNATQLNAIMLLCKADGNFIQQSKPW